jgi:hydrogenase nickel incorporation protein HypB
MVNLLTGIKTVLAQPHDHEEQHTHASDTDGHRHDHGHHDHCHAGHRHDDDHPHHHGHDTAQAPHSHALDLETRILAKNDAAAARIRAWLSGREILALNLVSSPGSGKTTLLERTIADLAGELTSYVIEGDQATTNDGERIRKAGAPVVQVNTGTGCHLDASMVAQGLAELRPGPGTIVLIENVGNLVCPALFDLGERAKVVIFSTTEGEDKPLKYPHMFRAGALVILNKIDLLPHLDFDVELAAANVRRINPDARLLMISAKTGEGLTDWYDWVRGEVTASRQLALL